LKERDTALSRRRLIVFSLLAATAVVTVLLLFRARGSGFRWDVLLDTVSQVHPGWMATAVSLILFTYLGRVLRWRVMMRSVRPHANVRNLLTSTVIGFTAVVFFGRPGEFVRPVLIARKERVPVSSQMAAWVVERIYDLLVVLLLFGFALTQVKPGPGIGPKLQMVLTTGGTLAATLALGCVVVLFAASRAEALVSRLGRRLSAWLPHRFRRPFESIVDSFIGAMSFAGSPRVVLELILFSLAEWAVILAGMYCVMRACPPTAGMSLIDTCVFAGFVAFGSAVQVPGIGGGMQVAAVVVLTELFGLALEASTGVALLLWAVSWLTVVPFGVLLAFREGLQWGSIRHMSEEVQETKLL
jgi:uncharacterized protein (TIRG00374 family)